METLPPGFVLRMKQEWPELWPGLEQELQSASPTSVLLNLEKPLKTGFFPGAVPIAWYEDGLLLSERPFFAKDPLWHGGAYYVQEASSMILGAVLPTLDLPQNPVVLDLSAAPGGKSLIIQNFLKDKGSLISNEPIPARNAVLRDNLDRWGRTASVVTQNYAADFAHSGMSFDLVVVDAPCSGEGMFRKDPDSRKEWSPEAVLHCSGRQSEILNDIGPCVAEGGYLIYSTCTFAAEENENRVRALLDSGEWELVELEHLIQSGMVRGREGVGIRFFPGLVPAGEGFFIAAIKKITPGNHTGSKRNKHLSPYTKMKDTERAKLRDWIDDSTHLSAIQLHDGRIRVIHPAALSILDQVSGSLKINRAGTAVGEFKRNDLIPDHGLALSLCLSHSVQSVDLELGPAQEFIRCGNPDPALFPDKGWTLVRYQGLGIGWVKSLGNRVNNYYPRHLRLLKE